MEAGTEGSVLTNGQDIYVLKLEPMVSSGAGELFNHI